MRSSPSSISTLPPLTFLMLSILGPPPREKAHVPSSPSSSSHPAHAHFLRCRLEGERRISRSSRSPLSLSSLLSIPPPRLPATSGAFPPLLLRQLITRMWRSLALLLSGFSALIHGEPTCIPLLIRFPAAVVSSDRNPGAGVGPDAALVQHIQTQSEEEGKWDSSSPVCYFSSSCL